MDVKKLKCDLLCVLLGWVGVWCSRIDSEAIARKGMERKGNVWREKTKY